MKSVPSHVWLGFDWAQAELYLLCLFSQDIRLKHALATGDVHRSTISDMYGIPMADVTAKQRDLAKVINYALPYSGFEIDTTVANILKKAPGTTKIQATEALEKYIDTYSILYGWTEHALFDWYDSHGWVAYFYGQRKRIIYPEYLKRDIKTLRRNKQGRIAINTYGQNSVGLLLKFYLAGIYNDPFLHTHTGQPIPLFDACSHLVATAQVAEVQKRLHRLATPVLRLNGFEVQMKADWKGSLTSWGDLKELQPTPPAALPLVYEWQQAPLAPLDADYDPSVFSDALATATQTSSPLHNSLNPFG